MRQRMTPKLKQTIFLNRGGVCHCCGCKIKVGERWEAEHIIPLALGGADDETNLAPAHIACHSDKTRTQDVPAIAKAKRIERRHIGIKKPRTIRAWRKFNGKEVFATRER